MKKLMIVLNCCFVLLSAAAKPKPNIVLFVADDLGRDDLGCYGANDVKTPNIDRLAEQSVLFTNAFANSPTCVPSRAILYTGLMGRKNGAHWNHSQSREGIRSIAHYFQEMGYEVVQAGKKHFNPPSVFPFTVLEGSEKPEPGFENGPEKGLHTDLQTSVVTTWLSRKHQKPFVLIVCDHSPHVVWPAKATYDPAKVSVPPNHVATPVTRQYRARYYTDIAKMDRNVGAVLQSLQENNLDDNTVFVFTADQGAQWPFAKWNLYDAGVRVPLLIRYPGKIKANSKTDALVSHVDLLPTLLDLAGGEIPSLLDGQSYGQALTGKAKRSGTDYIFLMHTRDGNMNISPMRGITNGRYKLIVNLLPQNIYTTHIDKAPLEHDGGQRYWASWMEQAQTDSAAAAIISRYHNRPKEEFYDTKTDPYEMINLIGDPEQQSTVNLMRKALLTWREKNLDMNDGTAESEPEKK